MTRLSSVAVGKDINSRASDVKQVVVGFTGCLLPEYFKGQRDVVGNGEACGSVVCDEMVENECEGIVTYFKVDCKCGSDVVRTIQQAIIIKNRLAAPVPQKHLNCLNLVKDSILY